MGRTLSDRDGIFAGSDPVALVAAWLGEATGEPSDPNAASLATVDAEGRPNVRIVLIKEIEPDGLVFYTNYESAKARELDGAGRAAVAIHWKSLRRQIRARGPVERVAAAKSDAYFETRSSGSRLGAWASRQSRPISSRAELDARMAEARARFGDTPPRPPHWGGYRLVPEEIEFWADGGDRLHDRFRWQRADRDAPWSVERVSP